MITDYQAKYIAYELTRRHPADSVEKLAGALVDAQVDTPSNLRKQWYQELTEKFLLPVCLDEAFRGNDQLKANAVQIFKSLHRRTGEGESSSDVTVFRTV